MAEFIEYLQKVTHVSGNSVERGDQNNIETMPAAICKKLVETWSFRFGAQVNFKRKSRLRLEQRPRGDPTGLGTPIFIGYSILIRFALLFISELNSIRFTLPLRSGADKNW
jgi:hypothetical protein